MSDRIALALAAVGHGLAVFDLPPSEKRPGPGWQQRATTDPEQVRRWLAAECNLGVGCRASAVMGLDLDRHGDDADGIASFEALCTRHCHDWPTTLTTATPRAGIHMYFRVPADIVVLSTSGGTAGLGPGIDTRGPGRRSGGYLLAPGSVVPAGAYTLARNCPIADLPDWLASLLVSPEQQSNGSLRFRPLRRAPAPYGDTAS
ncbi:bifunctional DNA primase/polymerase [Nocardia sp. NPDC058499]|uniref:bifunctional DNA primase/polymerase n=1 Tax=Nocardia sp. NPDC058499 TaxID=3346530 RepID=UPI003656CC92